MLSHTVRTPLLLLLSASASAQLLQSGVDSAGDLPACADQCTELQRAVTACGGQNLADAQTWGCFCQSAYLTVQNTPSTACQDVCDQAGNEQVASWFNGNCGDDLGQSNHGEGGGQGGQGDGQGNGQADGQGDGQGDGQESGQGDGQATPTTDTPDGVQTSAPPTTDPIEGIGNDGTDSGSNTGDSVSTGSPNSNSNANQSWWDGHWEWIVMVIVLAIGLTALGVGGTWLKRRHDRKQDQITSGFNAGITQRSAGPPIAAAGTAENPNDSSMMAGSAFGRDSPARTRSAFMPYGYGYARSESRLASRQDVDGRGTRGTTPMGEREKDVGGEAVGNEQAEDKKMPFKERILSKFGRGSDNEKGGS